MEGGVRLLSLRTDGNRTLGFIRWIGNANYGYDLGTNFVLFGFGIGWTHSFAYNSISTNDDAYAAYGTYDGADQVTNTLAGLESTSRFGAVGGNF